MAPSARVQAAFRAMKDIGIPEQKTKLVLKKLLKVYDKNWELIEQENYRVLADAIFEDEDTAQGSALAEEAHAEDEPERPLKRLRRGLGHAGSSIGPSNTALNGSSVKGPKPEPTDDAEAGLDPALGIQHQRNKGKRPMSPKGAEVPRQLESHTPERTSHSLHMKEASKEPGVVLSTKRKRPDTESSSKSSDGLFIDGVPTIEMPLAVVHPEPLLQAGPSATDSCSSHGHPQLVGSSKLNAVDKHMEIPCSAGEGQAKSVAPIDFEIATSSLGEVKVLLSCNSVLKRPNVHVPSLDVVMKYVEDKCLSTFKIVDPSFSVTKLMRDFCECFVELATSSSNMSLKRQINVDPAIDLLKRSALVDDTYAGNHGGSRNSLSSSLYGSVSANCSDNMALVCVSDESSSLDCPEKHFQANEKCVNNGSGVKNSNRLLDTNGRSLGAVEKNQLSSDDVRWLYDAIDMTRGEEKVQVPLFGESMNELPAFHYISQSIVYSKAQVKFSLARIGDKVCCPTCYGDCLLPSSPCACTYRNGGGFAYTTEGLLTESFLEKYMSEICNPDQNRLFHCKACPLEKCKNEDILEPCKGHLERKFIKECWAKCGCSRNCVNRVVQRGITCKLQVFWTPEGKGWGLRTLEELPKGAFVCEFAGEILTVTELHQRRLQRNNSTKHSYAVVLDAGWDSCSLKDDQTLCLDATFYGNVARFINHRCLDSNLVEIPVQVETPDRHYYHVALFSKTKIDALEELTWDYGIDFDYDQDHHFKPFHCLCGSCFCRKIKCSRSRVIPNAG